MTSTGALTGAPEEAKSPTELYKMLQPMVHLKKDALEILKKMSHDIAGLYAEISKKTYQVYAYCNKIDEQLVANAGHIKAGFLSG